MWRSDGEILISSCWLRRLKGERQRRNRRQERLRRIVPFYKIGQIRPHIFPSRPFPAWLARTTVSSSIQIRSNFSLTLVQLRLKPLLKRIAAMDAGAKSNEHTVISIPCQSYTNVCSFRNSHRSRVLSPHNSPVRYLPLCSRCLLFRTRRRWPGH